MKLFLVEVTANIPVMANDYRESMAIAEDNFEKIEKYDFSFFSSSEILDVKNIPEGWIDSVPFQKQSDNYLTCREVIKQIVELNRLKNIKEEQDKLQLKFKI
jgi:hypothetical protein